MSNKILHVTFVVKRHPENKQDLICRFKALNITEKAFTKFMIPLDTNIKRKIPISDSTLGIVIDEKDLTTFRIDVTVKINNNEEKIYEVIRDVIRQLKKQNKPRSVIAYKETRTNG